MAGVIIMPGRNKITQLESYAIELQSYVSHGYVPRKELLTEEIITCRPLIRNLNNALHVSVERGDSEATKQLADKAAKAIIGQNKFGKTPLHLAIEKGNSDIIDNLLCIKNSEKALETKDNNGQTPLDIAIQQGRLELIEKLLGKIRSSKNTFLNSLSQTNIVAKSISDKDQNGDTRLHRAVTAGNEEAIEALVPLLDANAINEQNEQGNTALHLAVRLGRATSIQTTGPSSLATAQKIVELLLKNNARTDIPNNVGNTALDVLRTHPDFQVAEKSPEFATLPPIIKIKTHVATITEKLGTAAQNTPTIAPSSMARMNTNGTKASRANTSISNRSHTSQTLLAVTANASLDRPVAIDTKTEATTFSILNAEDHKATLITNLKHYIEALNLKKTSGLSGLANIFIDVDTYFGVSRNNKLKIANDLLTAIKSIPGPLSKEQLNNEIAVLSQKNLGGLNPSMVCDALYDGTLYIALKDYLPPKSDDVLAKIKSFVTR